MQLSFTRKTVLISGATSLSVIVLVAIGIGFLTLQNDPRTTSLALRVEAARTEYFIRTSDRAFFERRVASILSVPIGNLPEGDRYEFASLQSGSGKSWVIYVHQTEEGKHVTVVSDEDPSLFLPAGKARASLGRTSLLRTYIASQDLNYIWSLPTGLPEGASITMDLQQMLLADAKSVLLLLEQGTEKGILIVETNHAPNSTSMKSAPLREPLAQATVELSNPKDAFARWASALQRQNAPLFTGLEGIGRHALKTHTDSTDLFALASDMLRGPISVELMRGIDDGVIFSVAGTAHSYHAARAWLQRMADTRSTSLRREIELNKGENVRIDMQAAMDDLLTVIEERDGWTLIQIGESGSTALYAALSGKNYVLSNEKSLLPPSQEGKDDMRDNRASYHGSIDLPWLAEKLRKDFSELSEGIKKDVDAVIGAQATRVLWTAKPVSYGWRIDWAIHRSSPVTGKLAK